MVTLSSPLNVISFFSCPPDVLGRMKEVGNHFSSKSCGISPGKRSKKCEGIEGKSRGPRKQLSAPLVMGLFPFSGKDSAFSDLVNANPPQIPVGPFGRGTYTKKTEGNRFTKTISRTDCEKGPLPSRKRSKRGAAGARKGVRLFSLLLSSSDFKLSFGAQNSGNLQTALYLIPKPAGPTAVFCCLEAWLGPWVCKNGFLLVSCFLFPLPSRFLPSVWTLQ